MKYSVFQVDRFLILLFVQMCHNNSLSKHFNFQRRLISALHLSRYC